MDKAELKNRLNEMGIDENSYSLNGSLEWDKVILYENYSSWEVFYLSERGDREDFHVFHTEEAACQYIYDKFKRNKEIADKKFSFVNEKYLKDLQLNRLGLFRQVPPTNNKQELLFHLSKLLNFPDSFQSNWDDLSKMLKSLHWIKEYRLIIFHHDLTQLPDADKKDYWDIVSEAVDYWDNRTEHSLLCLFSSLELELPFYKKYWLNLP